MADKQVIIGGCWNQKLHVWDKPESAVTHCTVCGSIRQSPLPFPAPPIQDGPPLDFHD